VTNHIHVFCEYCFGSFGWNTTRSNQTSPVSREPVHRLVVRMFWNGCCFVA